MREGFRDCCLCGSDLRAIVLNHSYKGDTYAEDGRPYASDGARPLSHRKSSVFRLNRALGDRLLHCLKDPVQVVGLRRLHRRELLVRHQLLLPEQLADGQDVPVVEIRGAWGAK